MEGGGRQAAEGQGDVGAKGTAGDFREMPINRLEINLPVTGYYFDHLIIEYIFF